MSASNRRKFLRQLGGTAALFSGSTIGAFAMDEEKIHILKPEKKYKIGRAHV